MKLLGALISFVSLLYLCLGVWFLVTSATTSRGVARLQTFGVEGTEPLDAKQLGRSISANGSLALGLGILGVVAGVGLIRQRAWAPPVVLTFSYVLLVLAVYWWFALRTRDQLLQIMLALGLAGVVCWVLARGRRVA